MLTHSAFVESAARVGLVHHLFAARALENGVHKVDARAHNKENIYEEHCAQYCNYNELVAILVASCLQSSTEYPFELDIIHAHQTLLL